MPRSSYCSPEEVDFSLGRCFTYKAQSGDKAQEPQPERTAGRSLDSDLVRLGLRTKNWLMKLSRLVAAGLMVLMAVFILAGKGSFPLYAEEPVEISFWHFWSNKWIDPILQQFEKENPDIKVKTERLTYQEGKNKIIIAFAAGQAPDLLEIGSTWATDFISAGFFEPIPPSFIPAKIYGLHLAEKQGQIYALPWFIAVSTLFYNKDLLKKAGFNAPPKDWKELLAQAQAIHQPKNRQYGFGIKLGKESLWQKFLPFAWSNGADLFKNGRVAVQDADFVEAVEFYQNLKNAGIMEDNLRIRNTFLQGRIGFILDDAGQIKFFRKNAPKLDFDTAPFPVASSSKRKQNFGGAQMLAVNHKSKHKQAAFKLLLFLSRLENVEKITQQVLTLYPALPESWQGPFYQSEHKELRFFLEEIPFTRSVPIVKNWAAIQKDLVFSLEKVLYGVSTPKQAMRDLESDIKVVQQSTQP